MNNNKTSPLNSWWQSIKYRAKRDRMAYFLSAPFFILFFIFTVLPVIISFYYSFTYYNMLQKPVFMGIDNYVKLLFYDDIFKTSLKNTMVFAIITAPIGYLLSLMVAWFINELSGKVRSIFVLLFYAPSISGNVYLVWKLLFSSDSYGYVNALLLDFGIISTPIQWFADVQYILPLLIIVQIWMSLGTGFLSFVAGLKGVDHALMEAGAIDGIRNRWQELWYITLPSIKPQMIFGAVLSITGAFAVSEISVNLAGNPSVQYAGHFIANHMSDYGNVRYEMGYASAIATVLFIITISCNKLINIVLKKVLK
ncbi:MAG: sugar ABC transporter permease [Acutalibacteraceae bacterium]|nr:sugar ABC transporter permease [Acutalibacteraceae bacterium]